MATSKSKSIPPPYEGWDTRTPLAAMKVERAIILDNWFPSTDKVTVRKGFSSYATGMSSAIESLIEYTPLTGTHELFAANNGAIYDVTASGAVGAAVV